MMCARLLKPARHEARGPFYRGSEWAFEALLSVYARILSSVLRHHRLTMAVTLSTIGLTVYLTMIVPKGFFPQQDTGRLQGSMVADQGTSSQATRRLIAQFARTISEDPAVEAVIAFTGGGGATTNTARMFVTLKPLAERKLDADKVIARLRGKLAHI